MAKKRYEEEDEDYDDRPIRKKELTGLDKMFAETAFPVLILFGFCCSVPAIILSAIAMSQCKDAKAKGNAQTVLIVAVVGAVIGVVLQIASVAIR